MSIKVVAIGNVLMQDDGIGIEAAKEIQEKLLGKGIEVIFGETDVQYSISKINENDYAIILDAAFYGKNLGDITELELNTFISKKNVYSQHNYSFLDLLKLYYPKLEGKIYGIEAKEVEFGFGLSFEMQQKLKTIAEEIIKKIEEVINNR